MNFIAILVAALVPTVLGFIWYHKSVFGKAWMAATGITDEDAKSGNMPLMMGLSLLFSFLLAIMLQNLCIHQLGVNSLLLNHLMEGSKESAESITAAKEIAAACGIVDAGSLGAKYTDGGAFGSAFRTFGHGMVHGFFAGLLIVLPIFATNGMFEKRPWKLTWINVGYWTLTLMLMCGILSAWQ